MWHCVYNKRHDMERWDTWVKCSSDDWETRRNSRWQKTKVKFEDETSVDHSSYCLLGSWESLSSSKTMTSCSLKFLRKTKDQ